MLPRMKLIVDQKRRVVLPKSVKPGDALEVMSTGDVIVLHLLKQLYLIHYLNMYLNLYRSDVT